MSELSKRLRQPCHMMDCLMARNQAADALELDEGRLEVCQEEISRLTAECERLRGALRSIMLLCENDAQYVALQAKSSGEIARKALGETNE